MRWLAACGHWYVNNGTVGVGAAKACAVQLNPNIRVVKPSELVERLGRAANPE